MPAIHVADQDIEVSKLDKEFHPEDHVTKGDVLEHYRAVAGVMLPHLAGRPLTLRRYPDEIGAEGFFQKDASDYFPDWPHIVEVPRRGGEGTVRHVVCDDPAALVYLANQATIEFHIWLSTVDNLDHPDRLVLDVDPPAGVPVATLRVVARQARDLFTTLGLTPFVQATGGRGYHVVAPLDSARRPTRGRRLTPAPQRRPPHEGDPRVAHAAMPAIRVRIVADWLTDVVARRQIVQFGLVPAHSVSLTEADPTAAPAHR